MRYWTHVIIASSLLCGLLIVGTVAFLMIEDGWSGLDAFYTAMVTITTVGMQSKALSPASQVVAIVLIFCSFGFVSYLSFTIGTAFITGQPQAWLRRRRIRQMNDHIIVCGYGRTGASVVPELVAAGRSVVVIEHDGDRAAEVERTGVPVVRGDATTDDALREARIEHAESLIAVLDSDPKNVYVALTARHMNPNIHVVSVAYDTEGETQLRRAGVSRIVSLREIGPRRLASAVLRPSVVDFIDLVDGDQPIELAETRIASGSPIDGIAIDRSRIRADYRVLIVGVKPHGADLRFNPDDGETLKAGDTLVVLGDRSDIEAFDRAGRGIAS